MATVLVAEDDPDICTLIIFKLKKSGYDVVACQDGRAALTSIRETKPDLVLLDVTMPGMSGLDVCRELRSDPDTAHLRILFLTARAQESDVREGMEAGADDYIVKPFSPRELMDRVNTALERSVT